MMPLGKTSDQDSRGLMGVAQRPLTRMELAEELGVSVGTVDRWSLLVARASGGAGGCGGLCSATCGRG